MNHSLLKLHKGKARRTIGLVCLALGAAVAPLNGQGLDGYAQNAGIAMRANNWPEAYAHLKKATDVYDGRAKKIFGPRFGWFWYNRGVAELKLGKYEDAMASFKKCNVDYANNKKEGNQSINTKANMALLLWGHAAKGAKQWQVAVDKYAEFMRKRDRTRDKVNQGIFDINNSICHFKLKNFEKGKKFLESAIATKLRDGTSNKLIMSSFVAMVESIIQKKNERIFLDFLAKNRGHVKYSPVEAYEYAPVFMQLAAKAKDVGMIRTTYELYSLVPSTLSAINDGNARKGIIGQYPVTIKDGSMSWSKSGLSEDLEKLESAQSKGDVSEVYAFLNTAIMHEDEGNVRGAFAVYEQLEHFFPKAKIMQEGALVPMRERNLYNLVRTASTLGEVFVTEKYGSRFLKAFPTSKYVPDVRRMMLVSLFWAGEYETCIKIAERMIPDLTNPSKEHDICLFVLGGSKYYNGEFVDAMPLLDGHVKTYPETAKHRRKAVLYFQASNHTKIAEWKKAGALLDAFLKKFPDRKTNVYMPFALFDRAQCHYSLDENSEALALCMKLEKEFKGAAIMEMNYNLIGNLLDLESRFDEAEAYHKRALSLAETKENRDVAGEALYYLVRLIGKERLEGNKENPRITEALPFYDKFWQDHGSDSAYQDKVAVVGLPAMKKAGRMEEGLTRMQGVITKITRMGGNGLEEVINSYTDAYLSEHTAAELKAHFYDFPGITSKDHSTLALLRIAVINVFEDVAASTKPEQVDERSRAQSQVKVLFDDLRSAFDLKDLSPYILVRVGDFLREKTSAPQQAVPYYEAALERQGHDYKFNALFGVADVLAAGSNKGRAVEYLERVLNQSEDKSQKEKALARMIDVLFEQGNYGKTITKATDYLSEPKYRKFSLKVRLTLGQARDKNGQAEDAMAVYAQVWGTAMGAVRYSAPAITRWLELTWERNGSGEGGKSDRQLAYESGYRYLDLTKSFKDKLSREEKTLYAKVESLVGEYEASGDTKTMAEIEKEKG